MRFFVFKEKCPSPSRTDICISMISFNSRLIVNCDSTIHQPWRIPWIYICQDSSLVKWKQLLRSLNQSSSTTTISWKCSSSWSRLRLSRCPSLSRGLSDHVMMTHGVADMFIYVQMVANVFIMEKVSHWFWDFVLKLQLSKFSGALKMIFLSESDKWLVRVSNEKCSR